MSQKEIKEEREKERESRIHQENLRAQSKNPNISLPGNDRDYLRELVQTKLTEGQQDLLGNLLGRDFVLANFTEAELNELRWELEIIRDMYFAMHPSADCVVTGDFRAYCLDDPDETVEPLTEREKMQVTQFFKGVQSRLTRARDMKQQEMMSKTIRESRTKTEDGGGDGGGVLGRIR